MANLDTANKRRSSTGVLSVFTVPPVPDGTLGAQDREQATHIYAGIAPGTTGEAASLSLNLEDGSLSIGINF
jgi:hypothetical protein